MTQQQDTPLIGEPNLQTIVRRAIGEARITAFPNTSDPLAETREFDPAPSAPGLEEAARQAMAEYEMPEGLWRALDQEEEHLAGRTLELLPQDEREALELALGPG